MEESAMIKVEQCKLGDTIRFKTISNVDVNVYSGKVIGIVDFERARTYGDVAATHLQMEQGASLNGKEELIDVTQQKFLIVSCSSGEVIPFGFEWLQSTDNEQGVVERIAVGYTYTIRLYNVSSAEAATAMNLLRQNGYVCKLLKKNTEGEYK